MAGDAKEDGNTKACEAYAYITELAHEAMRKAQAFARVVEETSEEKGSCAYDSLTEGTGKAMRIGSNVAQNAKETSGRSDGGR
ncbi:hypothetical protein Hdeb2414_s0337g00871161 [Helianthus debilis subsp. tardiflorus]